MATNDSERTGFRIAHGAISGPGQSNVATDSGEIPRFVDRPLLFAIARDPRTLFIYWNIDWPTEFRAEAPVDRQVYLRVLKENGVEESESIIEPMLGSFYAVVAKPHSVYRVELGYYGAARGWKSVAISDAVTMPPESVSENTVVDVATVPFHLSFQKMIDLFCETNGDPLATVLARAQERALTNADVDLGSDEREILRAMNLSVNQLRAARESLSDRPNDEALRRRAEAVLGFGSTSPARGFGGSSRA